MSNARGFTLIEVMVSAAISSIVIAAVFAFAAQETRLLGTTGEHLDLLQTGRGIMSTLEDDLRHGGGGIGVRPDGTFDSVLYGNFNVGGVAFSSKGQYVYLTSGPAATDDIGVVLAVGGQASIAKYSSSGGLELCAGSGIENNELVILRTPDSLLSRSVILSGKVSKPCSDGVCVNGCEGFNWADDPTYLSEPAAAGADYSAGEASGQLRRVVWFVVPDPNQLGIAQLRRAVFDNVQGCDGRNADCGDLMAENVESLQVQVWQWHPLAGAWVNVTNTALEPALRVRIDVELVIRSRYADDKLHDPVALRLQPGITIPPGGAKDQVRREVFRTSIEVKNSGRMAIN